MSSDKHILTALSSGKTNYLAFWERPLIKRNISDIIDGKNNR